MSFGIAERSAVDERSVVSPRWPRNSLGILRHDPVYAHRRFCAVLVEVTFDHPGVDGVVDGFEDASVFTLWVNGYLNHERIRFDIEARCTDTQFDAGIFELFSQLVPKIEYRPCVCVCFSWITDIVQFDKNDWVHEALLMREVESYARGRFSIKKARA